MNYKNVYVAATSQHVGKTTSTLGLVAAFIKRGVNAGYCKPVGQKLLNLNNVEVDKDAILFADLVQFQLNAAKHSPVILGKGATTAFIDQPDKFNYADSISTASQELDKDHDLVIYEGTGHPGVGSIVDLSNADVAKMVNASVIMIVEGGVGSTIDMLSLCLAKFQMLQIPILGVIINKVKPSKIDKVRKYVGKHLSNIGLPLLGVIPYDKSLAFPLMRTVTKAINGIVSFNEDELDRKVEDILAGSLIDLGELKSSKDLLLVVSASRVADAIAKIQSISKLVDLEKSPLSGIVATGHGSIDGACSEYIQKHRIPVVRTTLDTYGSVLKISRIEVKINRSTPWKVSRAIELIEKNVDMDALLKELEE
ncbi:MAG: AAA family ATPase [Bacteroidota bacterium]